MGEERTITQVMWQQDQPVVLQSIAMEVDRKLAQNGGQPLTWGLSEKQSRRSLDANRYFWVMAEQIGRDLGSDDKQLTHDFLLDECFGKHYGELGGKQVRRRPRTSQFTVKQMSKFISWCLEWADANCSAPIMMPAAYDDWAKL